MKEYKQNMDDKDTVFESRKNSIVAASSLDNKQSPTDALNDDITDDTNVELSSIKESIENVDVWSQRKEEEK